jgi:hypothetical protein
MCRRPLVVLALFAGAVVAVNCGGSSGARTGTGGSSATGAGGTAGSGGSSTGNGGAGGSSTSTLSCSPGVNPARALLTDFSDWDNTAGKWGMIGNLRGSKFPYVGTNANTSMAAAVTNGALVLSGNVAAGDYAGGGMSFDSCVNTTTYHGIQFTLGGTVAGCDLSFNVQTFEQQANTNGGGCDKSTSSCYSFPKKTLTFSTNPITVMFSDLSGGMPTDPAAIAAEIVGLQWQFQSPAPTSTPPPAVDAGTITTDDGAVADAPISTDDAAISTDDAAISLPDASVTEGGPVQQGCMGIMMTIDDVSFVP